VMWLSIWYIYGRAPTSARGAGWPRWCSSPGSSGRARTGCCTRPRCPGGAPPWWPCRAACGSPCRWASENETASCVSRVHPWPHTRYSLISRPSYKNQYHCSQTPPFCLGTPSHPSSPTLLRNIVFAPDISVLQCMPYSNGHGNIL